MMRRLLSTKQCILSTHVTLGFQWRLFKDAFVHMYALVWYRGRPKFGFCFGFGAESWQMASFGIVSVSAEGRKLPFGIFRFRPKLTLTFGHQPKVYLNFRNATLVLLLLGLTYSACQAVSLRKAILSTKKQIHTCARVYILESMCICIYIYIYIYIFPSSYTCLCFL